MTSEQIQFIDLQAQRQRLGSSVNDAISAVLDHGNYIMGPEVGQLEAALAQHSGAAQVVTCSSGTDSLLMVLMAHGLGPGDAVIVPSFTFAASAEVIALVGATPVFAEILDDGTFNIDPSGIERCAAKARADGLTPRGVMPVGLFGQPADLDGVTAAAEALGLWVLDDAAQSYGAVWRGRKVGTLGHTTSTSFFPAKPLGCYGDGGAIFTDDEEFADRLRSIRVHGKGSHKYDNVRIGINGRLDTIQAAVLLCKLEIFDDELARRQAVADRYDRALEGHVAVPRLAEGATSSWAQYTVKVEERERVQAELKAAGIPTAVYYPRPLHTQTAYREFPIDPTGLAISERIASNVLSLPMHPYLSQDTQDRITSMLCSAIKS